MAKRDQTPLTKGLIDAINEGMRGFFLPIDERRRLADRTEVQLRIVNLWLSTPESKTRRLLVPKTYSVDGERFKTEDTPIGQLPEKIRYRVEVGRALLGLLHRDPDNLTSSNRHKAPTTKTYRTADDPDSPHYSVYRNVLDAIDKLIDIADHRNVSRDYLRNAWTDVKVTHVPGGGWQIEYKYVSNAEFVDSPEDDEEDFEDELDALPIDEDEDEDS